MSVTFPGLAERFWDADERRQEEAMGYTTDWKPTKDENPSFVCRECKSDEVEYREWESSDGAHDDLHYRCKGCSREWWVEGPDY